ncbi:MAG: dienelactone hydrolase family protein [Alphaproteobacteria bacterium]|nr:dienelactone hydrolase family protein [Alphaproteobacteria bacterium]
MLSGPEYNPNPGKPIQKIVVFLHGYGASGDDLLSLGEAWESSLPNTLFIAPNAPDRCDMNMDGYQWFGLQDFSPFNVRSGLDRVRPTLVRYLKNLLTKHTLNTHDLALVGFSQGTILALEMLFALPGLGAVLGYSGAFYPPPVFEPPLHSALGNTNVMLVHGTADMVVPYSALLQASAQLNLYGIQAQTHTCDGVGHTIDFKGLELGGEFLGRNLMNCSRVVNL